MRTQTILFLALFITGIFSGCKKDDAQPAEYDYLVFGKYYGFCGGENCIEVFKIENGVLYEDSSDVYPAGAPYQGAYVALSAAQYNLVKDLVNEIPAQLLNEPNGHIGIPDAYDQGGFVVEVKENGTVKYWRIDTHSAAIPAYLASFNDTLRSYIDAISN